MKYITIWDTDRTCSTDVLFTSFLIKNGTEEFYRTPYSITSLSEYSKILHVENIKNYYHSIYKSSFFKHLEKPILI